MLASFFCAHNRDPGWEINSSDTGLNFVDVLTSFATAPEGFKYNLLQICHLYAHTMTRKRFSHLGMTAIKPRTIS